MTLTLAWHICKLELRVFFPLKRSELCSLAKSMRPTHRTVGDLFIIFAPRTQKEKKDKKKGRVFCLCLEMGLRPAQELGGIIGRLSTIISALQSPSSRDRGLGVRGIGIAKSSDAGSNPNDPPPYGTPSLPSSQTLVQSS